MSERDLLIYQVLVVRRLRFCCGEVLILRTSPRAGPRELWVAQWEALFVVEKTGGLGFSVVMGTHTQL